MGRGEYSTVQYSTFGWTFLKHYRSPVGVWLLAEAGPGEGVRAVGEAAAVLARVGGLLPLELPAHAHAAHGLRQVGVPAITTPVSCCILHVSRPMVEGIDAFILACVPPAGAAAARC